MVQVRKLVLAIAAASALSSGMAQALGLGELTLKSTPNQPLVAEIELLDVQQLTAAEVVPSLASPEDFAKAGVPRQAFLNDLAFTPVINANGKSVLRVTSSRPLSEPLVKFLVQVMWPNGRLLRDYSVLVDPSKFSPQAAEAARPKPPQVVSTPVTGATKSSQYTTTPRDTLWEIAAKARNGGSVQQTMLAIQALNPHAFIDGNINLLKTGQVLRLPDPVQSTALPQPQAIAEVAAQNAAWRQGRQGRATAAPGRQQLDATKRGQGEAVPAQTAGRDNLSLVTAESAKAGKGKGAAGDAQALSNKLAVTQESLDSARRDNEELKSRMADLQSQLDKLQRLIELKNNQLAKMQAEGAAVPPASETPPAMSAQLTPAPSAQVPAPAPPVAPEATTPEAAPAAAPAEAPAVSNEQKYNDLLTNPILLGLIGGGVLVLLLLLLLLARRRKAQQEAEKHLRMARALEEEADFSPELDLPPSSFEGIEVPAPSVKLDPKPAPAPAPKPVPRPAPVVAPVMVSPPIAAPLVAPAADRFDDVLGQAQAHIDRGRLNQAADQLEQGIKAEPQRSDLRLKLMEVYGLQGDRDAFIAQERQLVANGENFAQVEQLKSRFPAMVVATSATLAAAAVAAELDAQYVKELLEETPATNEELDSAFDLSLDDLENTPTAPAPEPVPELDAFPMDDDLSFESVLKQQTEANESLDDLSEFDLDLGADAPAPALDDEDFLLDLGDDLKGLDEPAADTSALLDTPADDLELPADFDLSLADEMDAPKDPFESELDDVNAELDRLSDSLGQPSFTAEDALASVEDEPDFDFLSGTNEVATKLDLAQAYIDMGDHDGARDILGEVLSEGDATQKSEAQEMLARLV
ncbi:pilus assembly protein FimV [Pseudomonas sp. SJZ085]|uniref:FimV/HubP family polar landmark protein n=1 Tax=unclassified Pseudomonas TaxID=196821 RepID=UPI00119A2DE8|nr:MULTISPECIES: FimV/HubP family polar landmark protein [unclassified Pseudomonas]TWC18571.1 pilus assembly protein FimV [Pseudomonas sp. SJZ074]TWC36354.1 pilus assembly protein FimV [Pseudomonas sp. SJZ085]